MNVIDLLPDHPAAPKRERLKAFLPNLMTIFIDVKSKLLADSDNAFSRKTLKRANELLNSTIAWITYQVKMVRHQHVSDKLARPSLIQVLEFLKESITTSWLSKYRSAPQAIPSNKMQSAREIKI